MKNGRNTFALASIAGLLFTLLVFNTNAVAQTEKKINHQSQVWVSLNNTIKLTPKWGMVADFHIRRNNFISDPSFYFIRFGADYWFNKEVSAVAGYGHMWVGNPVGDKFVFTNENRIYQQIQYSSKINKVGLLLRLRNEQRWQQKMKNGAKLDANRFTDRFRFLTSFSIPLFKSPNYPRLMIADEIAVQMGKEVIYNTFDQNRLSVGIQQKISKTLSFDLAYMLVNQQKYSGYQYDQNNTLRLFFYYTPDFTKAFERHHMHLSGEE